MLWAIAAATDYGTGLIRILVQAHPNRVTLLASKIAALSIFTLLATTVTTFVAVVFAAPRATRGHRDRNMEDRLPLAPPGGLLQLHDRGAGLGTDRTHARRAHPQLGHAIGIGIGFLLVVEGLITIVAPDAGPYLPGGTLNTLAAGGKDQLASGAALGPSRSTASSPPPRRSRCSAPATSSPSRTRPVTSAGVSGGHKLCTIRVR